MFNIRKNLIQVCNDMSESMMTVFIFGWTIPLMEIIVAISATTKMWRININNIVQSEQQKGNKLKEWILLNLNLSSRRTLLVCSLKWLHFRASMMFISEHSKCLTIGKWIEGSKLWLLVMCPAFNVECYIRIKGGLCWDRWLCISVSALFRKYRTLAFIHGCLSCVHFYLLCGVMCTSLEQWPSSYYAAVEQKYKWPQCLLSRETSSLQLCSRTCNLWKSSVVSLATLVWPLVDGMVIYKGSCGC